MGPRWTRLQVEVLILQLPPYLIAVISTLLMSLTIMTSPETTYLLVLILIWVLLDLTKYPLLLIAPMVFLLVPKYARGLGILVFGLLLASPKIRVELTNYEVLKLFSLSLVILLLISPRPRNTIAKILWLATVVLGSVTLDVLTPIAPLLVVAYFLALPRDRLAYLYSIFTVTGFWVLYRYGLFSFPTPSPPPRWIYEAILIPVLVITYSILKEKGEVLRKKQTLVILLLALLMTPFIRTNEAEFTLLLSTDSVRLIASLPHEETL